MNNPEDKTIKTIVVGDGSVGKTCMLHAYAKNEFVESYVPTVFDDYIASVFVDGKRRRLELVDTAGQEDYSRFRTMSYINTDVIILAFSLVSPVSFANAEKKWIKEIRELCPNTAVLLCGTKLDLRNNPQAIAELSKKNQLPISSKQGYECSKRIKAQGYFECSAITKEGLKDVFDAGIRIALQKENNLYKENHTHNIKDRNAIKEAHGYPYQKKMSRSNESARSGGIFACLGGGSSAL